MSSQTTINEIIDYNRKNVYNIGSSDAEIVNEVSSINLNDYLKRNNKLFHLCILKSMKDTGIESLGELVREYETELDENTCKKMKIITNAFPNNLLEIAAKNDEDTKYDEHLINLNINTKIRKNIFHITTRELQVTLKEVLGKVVKMDFNKKLSVDNFEPSMITSFRANCKNIKFRSIFFRLIHNDFFTRERMKKFGMVNGEECVRCGQVENSKHLLWECQHVKKIWSIFNKLINSGNNKNEVVNQYCDVFKFGQSASINTIKIKVIQELIQIERPINWTVGCFKEIITEIIRIEKYNAISKNAIRKFEKKWNESIRDLNKI